MSINLPTAILTKITKLRNMQDSATAIGNEQEALAFASKVQSMLLDYKLSMSDIDNHEFDDSQIIIDREDFDLDDSGLKKTKKRNIWLCSLAAAIARSNGCEVLISTGSNRITIIGTESSRSIVSYMLTVLVRFGVTEMDSQYRKSYYIAKKQGDVNIMRGWKKAFISAYVVTITERLQSNLKDITSNVTERGLIYLDQESSAVKDYLSTLGVKTSTLTMKYRNTMGFDAGCKTGAEAELSSNDISNSGKRMSSLSVF